MNVFLGLLFDYTIQRYFADWYTYFFIYAVLQCLVKPVEELIHPQNILSLILGLIGFAAFDVMKYGRVGIGWLTVFLIFFMFKALQHYFLSNRAMLLILLLVTVVFLDIVCFQPFLLGFHMSLGVVSKKIFGMLTTITLALLGAWGSRFWSLKDHKRKVWTPNRKSAL